MAVVVTFQITLPCSCYWREPLVRKDATMQVYRHGSGIRNYLDVPAKHLWDRRYGTTKIMEGYVACLTLC